MMAADTGGWVDGVTGEVTPFVQRLADMGVLAEADAIFDAQARGEYVPDVVPADEAIARLRAVAGLDE